MPECAPARYQTVAKLDASKLGNFSSQGFNKLWIGELREQAAGLGANGLLITPINTAMTAGAIRHGPAFKAAAIRVSPTLAPPPGTSPWAKGCAAVAKKLRYEVFQGMPPGMDGSGSD